MIYIKNWKKIRNVILERDGYECQKCGRNKIKLNVHHINLNRLDNRNKNLITLCDKVILPNKEPNLDGLRLFEINE